MRTQWGVQCGRGARTGQIAIDEHAFIKVATNLLDNMHYECGKGPEDLFLYNWYYIIERIINFIFQLYYSLIYLFIPLIEFTGLSKYGKIPMRN